MDELEDLGALVVAATADDRESTESMAQEYGLTFPVAYRLEEGQLQGFDPWWADDRHGRYPQPMEFLVLREGTIFGSVYGSGPVGRMYVDEVLTSIRGRERRRLGT